MIQAGDRRRWLIDKSALVRLRTSRDATDWVDRVDRGLVRITTATVLEVGLSARNAENHRLHLRQPPVSAMPSGARRSSARAAVRISMVENFTPAIERRAVEVQALLAAVGQHALTRSRIS